MVTLTIDLDDELARHVQDSARREQRSISEWVKQRLTPETDRAAVLLAMEALRVPLNAVNRFVNPAKEVFSPLGISAMLP